ncbi:hypothetical protein N658DRAFT_483068 [Parathielavia hyrcaniae]|uniref:Swi5-dependent recombination DNA repair protein 1 n=1 Tax=Parathielavia hyrcaniae TaxID=113614 RepID=A0AAN6Q8K1_9PEZI|nr:hypothetical protein N658DRAFT_483068 [Parathielavia hyrcaniae]
MSFQTPSGPAAKRRRIETANATLRKPFRSPLIARKEEEQGDSQALSPSNIVRGSPAIAVASPALSGGNHSSPPPPTQKRPATKHVDGHPHGNDDDVDDVVLLSRILASQRQLASQLRAAQAQLDLVRQARRIEQASAASATAGRAGGEGEGEGGIDGGGGGDAGLQGMISRWKAASRLAAEDLFELVRGRVEGVGGVRAWRARQREGGSGRERERERDDESGGEDGNEDEEDGEETEFTMLAMLKSLNIDPDVVGYDPVEDRWRD